jgi:GT2 family glycosyltransferase
MSAPHIHEAEPHVTFIILNWNQYELTLDCLESLGKLEYTKFDVIVVDNGSTDGSVEKIRQAYPNCGIIENKENLGYSEGNNVGIRRALEQETEFIFLLNNDTLVDPQMLSRLVVEAQQDPTVGITGPTMFYADPPTMLWGGRNWVNWRKTRVVRERMGETVERTFLENQPPIEAMYIDSCAILVRSQVFKEIGLMDNRFFINFDDIDLCLRARKAGYKIIYVPSAVMWHRISAAMGIGSPATTYYMTRNSLILFTKYAPGVWKFVAMMIILLNTGRTVGAWMVKPQYRTETYRRKRIANIFAVRDFLLGRFGRMGRDVTQICFGR